MKNYNIQDNVFNTNTDIININDISKNNIKSTIIKNNDIIISKSSFNDNRTKDNIKLDNILSNYSFNLNSNSFKIKKRKSFPLTKEEKSKKIKNNYST